MAEARGVRRRVPIAALVHWRIELRQLEPSVAVRGLHDRDLCPDALEPHDTVHPAALDWGSARDSSPSATKNSVAAARSSATMPTWSIRWIVMCSPSSPGGPAWPLVSLGRSPRDVLDS
jgi:hypothetical protein